MKTIKKNKRGSLGRINRADKKQARQQINAVGKKKTSGKIKSRTKGGCVDCTVEVDVKAKGPVATLPKWALNTIGKAAVYLKDPLYIPGPFLGKHQVRTHKSGSTKRQDVRTLAKINKRISDMKPAQVIESTGGGPTGRVYSPAQVKVLKKLTAKRQKILDQYKPKK